MTQSVDGIRKALETKLAAISGLPSIAYENVRFDPTTGQSYIKASVIPTQSRPVVVGSNPQVRSEGLFSLLVCIPEGQGVGSAQSIVNTLITSFAPSTDATSGNVRVSLDYVESSRGFSDTPYYCIPVSVGWHTYH